MTKKQKLELTWIGKDDVTKLEPRILIEDAGLSYHALKRHSEADLFDNKLIFGDNLLALKALEKEYAEKIKCVFIDPPYNTGNAFEHYDDGLEHSIWLSLIRDRLEIIKKMLTDDGVIFVQIDDVEQAYLKVLMDEVFGRKNFINTISVNMKNIAGASGGGEDKKLKKNIEYIHVYSKNYEQLMPFEGIYDYIPMSEVVEQYREEGKSWKYTSILFYEGDKEYVGSTVDGDGNEIKIYLRLNPVYKSINQVVREEKISEKDAYDKYAGKIFEAKDAQSSIRTRVIEARTDLSIVEDLISIEYVPKTGRNKGVLYEQFYKGEGCRLFAWLRDIGETKDGVLYKKNRLGTYWDATSSINNLTKEGGVQFANGKKPESLINKIIQMCTVPGDIVLDSFAGSGTTGAVAHKMGRRWVMIELGEHCHTHVIPRLKKVIDGEDQGGITVNVDWKGGGGFRYYKLAPSLLAKDKWDNWVINKDYDANMLAAAVCKHEGFTYSPSETEWWAHGFSTETDFIYVTTQTLTEEQLLALSEDVGSERTLLVCCSAFKASAAMLNDKLSNLTLKKMPHALLSKCEWGKDDYSLNISQLPVVELDDVEQKVAPKKKSAKKEADLFGEE
jgi:adenine-specific DNA-methyltransferase